LQRLASVLANNHRTSTMKIDPDILSIHRGLLLFTRAWCGSPDFRSRNSEPSRGAEAPLLHRISSGASGARGDCASSSVRTDRLPPIRIQVGAFTIALLLANMVEKLSRQPNRAFLHVVRQTLRPEVQIVDLFVTAIVCAANPTVGPTQRDPNLRRRCRICSSAQILRDGPPLIRVPVGVNEVVRIGPLRL
jgi:hypothetical protein